MKKYVIEKDTLYCYTTSDIKEMTSLREDVKSLPDKLPEGYCYIDEHEFILVNKVKNGLATLEGWEGNYPVIKEKTDEELSKDKAYFYNSGKQVSLRDGADRIIQPMIGYSVAGILSEEERERFRAWNEYRRKIDNIDITKDTVEWPEKPE